MFPNKRYDFLVIGSGITGLFYALKVADHGTVAVATKADLAESNTNYAQGGIASVFSPDDSFDLHIRDTLEAGRGLCRPEVVKQIVEQGPAMIRELQELGARFTLKKDRKKQGEFDLGREGGHSKNRIVHASDLTGKEIERALVQAVREHPGIDLFENHVAIDLITLSKVRPKSVAETEEDAVIGAYILDAQSNAIRTFLSPIVLLATGGCGKVYLYTSNPDISSGDGIAMAYRAGAKIANLEFMQFHPTCLYHPLAKSFLISEAVRGEGGILKLRDGSTFMEKYHPLACLAPRDVVARAIDTEMKKRGDDFVYLDCTHIESQKIHERFPNIHRRCLDFGFDMTRDPLPVVPAAHYMCGGVLTDLDGKTSVPNLYAAGEVACTGLHGANRLASNSLLEAVVVANRSARSSVERLREMGKDLPVVPPWDPGEAVESDEMVVISHTWDEIRRLMWNYVGIVRTKKRLSRAVRRIGTIQEEIQEYYWNFTLNRDLIELRNLALTSELIIRCALMRKESRGLHFNLDYPGQDDARYRSDTVIQIPKQEVTAHV
jgi:L-aspartate oxidase